MLTQVKFGTPGWSAAWKSLRLLTFALLLCGKTLASRWARQLKALCNQVGSFYPQRENFRLTPEVKDKFTGKLESDPREFCGH